jgi:hypothetical protein
MGYGNVMTHERLLDNSFVESGNPSEKRNLFV